VVFDATTEQIHAASRSRLTGLLVDLMAFEKLSGTPEGAPTAPAR
jgi:hypothetical protein